MAFEKTKERVPCSGDTRMNESLEEAKSNAEMIPSESAASRFIIFKTPLEKIREAIAANMGDTGVSATDFERIKIPAGGGLEFTIRTLTGEKSVKELIGIVVASRETRAFWSVPLEQSDGSMPPDCHSLDGWAGVGRPGGDCRKCEFARFGSSANGGPACKRTRELFFLFEDDSVPRIICLPQMSIPRAEQYLAHLAFKAIPCYEMVTSIGLEKATNKRNIPYSRATFAAVCRLPAEWGEFMKQYTLMHKSQLKLVPSATTENNVQQLEGEII